MKFFLKYFIYGIYVPVPLHQYFILFIKYLKCGHICLPLKRRAFFIHNVNLASVKVDSETISLATLGIL